jgi:DNA-directed RNA polymerase specialized sigma24 family protein
MQDEEFRDFMHARWPAMVRLAYALTGDQGHAEDVAQAAFARAYASWPRVRGTGDPEGYVRRIVINENRAQVRLQQLANQVRIEVRNAQFALQQNRASVQAAQAAVDFARETLDAEQQKLKVGVSNPTAVLQDQSGLTNAESNLVSAKAAYEKARVELDRATGLLLDHSGIVMADAERGAVTHMPNVPYIAPRQESQPGAAAQPQPPGY